MLKMPQYKSPITLIPGGCPQLLDYESPNTILDSIKYSFEEIVEKGSAEKRVHLHAYRKNKDGEFEDEMEKGKFSQGYGYELNGVKAIQPWLNQWIPVPFLRTREQTWPDTDECRFEYGPSNWARAYLTMSDTSSDMLRLVLAFDMAVEADQKDGYVALTDKDVDENATFRLAWRFRDNSWFLDLDWVEEWLKEAWDGWLKKNRRRPSEDWSFEHLAYYLTFLEAILLISGKCEVKVIKPDDKSCVDVDLVLDIGNSRTTGLLIETQTQSKTNLNNSYLLQLRDMSQPWKIYTDPFDTKIEFSEISFGNDALSMRSGRPAAFSWPSPVRMGLEAGRLATLSRCGEGSTGMSSPKRYLWDERDWLRTWRFNTGTEKAPYVTRGKLVQEVNSSGTPLCCMEDKEFTNNKKLQKQERESAFESLFTRSSLMMFLFVEIIQQALLTINSPGQRVRRDLSNRPRRLRQIIFTVPAGMPVAEQDIYKRWAKWAVHVLWEALGWKDYYVGDKKKQSAIDGCDYRTSPVVRCEWDEATCTQLVYLYNEIKEKFQGDAQFFCESIGQPRVFGNNKERPSVRIAAIDIGGGTTDLSITTFELANSEDSTPRFIPHPNFHDGFSKAGDDILNDIIKKHVCGAIGGALEKAGVQNPTKALSTLFGRVVMDSSKDVLDQRVQFIRQIAVPVALCLLSLYEKTDMKSGSGKINFTFGDCFIRPPQENEDEENEENANPAPKRVNLDCDLAPMPNQAAQDYVRDYVLAYGTDKNFNIMDVPITMDAKQIDLTVREALKYVLRDLCEVINLYDCDVLLLTGRPTRWPGIMETFFSLAPLPPTRIVPMGEYHIGDWYPFSDVLGNMTDPKTTVVVGAILCVLAEGQLEGFSFDPAALHLSSNARFIGQLETTGQLKNGKVWFKVNPEKGTVSPKEKTVIFNSPMFVGFRQLDVESWTTTTYYHLDWSNKALYELNKNRLPLSVKISLHRNEKDSSNSSDKERQADEGEFIIEEIVDKNGDNPSNNILEMRLQTLPNEEGFWLDTGIISEKFE